MTIRTTGVVDERGELTLHVRTQLPPGEWEVEVSLVEAEAAVDAPRLRGAFALPVFDLGLPPGIVNCDREELYG